MVSQKDSTESTGSPDKITLHLATPTVEGFAGLYKRLTGKDMTPEGLARLREILTEE